jgi:hypothetical protein
VSATIARHSGGFVAGALYQVVKAGAALNWWDLAPGGGCQCLHRRPLLVGEFVRYVGQASSGGDGVTVDLFTATSGERGRFTPCFYGLALGEFLRGPGE